MERLSLSQYITKVVWPAFGVTMRILIATVILATILGLIMAMLLTVTKKDGIKPNKFIFNTLDFLINIIRSFPFLILLVSLVPVTRFIMGTSIGERAAIFPLTVSMSPFVARLIASHMDSVERQLIEAAQSFGALPRQILWHVIMVEAVPGIVSVISFTFVTGLGATTAAGMVGAGGLGSIAMRYGYSNFNDKIMYSTVLILIILVQIIQYIGDWVYRKVK